MTLSKKSKIEEIHASKNFDPFRLDCGCCKLCVDMFEEHGYLCSLKSNIRGKMS